MSAAFLILLMGMLALAIDLSRLFNRKAELQGAADVAALAAARQLTGSPANIDKAVSSAQVALEKMTYEYDRTAIPWSASALQFASAPNGPWMDALVAKGSSGIVFAKFETSQLSGLSMFNTLFLQLLSPSYAISNPSVQAIAGRSAIKVTPLAVCAMSDIPAKALGPNQELVQYGFRRGVGYDLMNLNPKGKTPANFLVNPIDPWHRVGQEINTSTAVVSPFVCSGTMPMAHMPAGGKIRVTSPFPISSQFGHLNSRLDIYTVGNCKHRWAPPDLNVKWYPHTTAAWMKTAPARQTAAVLAGPDDPLITIADQEPSGVDTAQYGLLWAFARPVPFSAYNPDEEEPKDGYAPFPRTAWKALYSPGQPEPKISAPASSSDYPASGAPYDSRASLYFQKPDSTRGRGLSGRRVLNVPLLNCPVEEGLDVTATVLAIGRFFMTVPATSTTISAEFAGIASNASLDGGTVELYK